VHKITRTASTIADSILRSKLDILQLTVKRNRKKRLCGRTDGRALRSAVLGRLLLSLVRVSAGEGVLSDCDEAGNVVYTCYTNHCAQDNQNSQYHR